MERIINQNTYIDYPDKFAKKVDWWRSEEGISLIRGWRSQGRTIKEVVDMMGVDPRTFKSWRKKYHEFDEAMAVGADVANSNVMSALYKKACGYDYFEEVYELVEGELRLTRRLKRHMSPDTKAILAWLYNRMPNAWRAIQEPLENTQYRDTIKDILIAMRDVAENGGTKQIEVSEENSQ